MMDKRDTIIVVGVGPVPLGNPERVYATGLRLFAFSRYIHQSGFRVIMGEACFEGENALSVSPDEPEEIDPGWERRVLPNDPAAAAEIINRWIQKTNPTALVSTTDVMNRAISLVPSDIPKWMDFNGHPMAERQELGFVHESDDGLIDQWLYILPSLLNGDHFSTCSTPQKFALIGELGAVGRLNRFNSGYDLVTVLKPGAVLHEPQPDHTVAFRGKMVSNDAFCLLWNGGFNTWVDEQTLYDGICLAMNESERIQFIITGGEIKGHNEKTFENFRQRVNQGKYSSRFHFFGWVPLKSLPNFYAEADAAINIDRFTYEAILGFRNRIFSWLNYKLPIITTSLSENTKELVAKGYALGFTTGKAEDLAKKILYVMKNPGAASKMAENAHRYLLEEYDYTGILKPLLAWLSNPRKAPDLAENHRAEIDFQAAAQIAIPENTLSLMNARFADKTTAIHDLEKRLASLRRETECCRTGLFYKILKRLGRIWGK